MKEQNFKWMNKKMKIYFDIILNEVLKHTLGN